MSWITKYFKEVSLRSLDESACSLEKNSIFIRVRVISIMTSIRIIQFVIQNVRSQIFNPVEKVVYFIFPVTINVTSICNICSWCNTMHNFRLRRLLDWGMIICNYMYLKLHVLSFILSFIFGLLIRVEELTQWLFCWVFLNFQNSTFFNISYASELKVDSDFAMASDFSWPLCCSCLQTMSSFITCTASNKHLLKDRHVPDISYIPFHYSSTMTYPAPIPTGKNES